MVRTFISDCKNNLGGEVLLKGWIYRLRELPSTTFIVLKDCSGIVQCVLNPKDFKDLSIKLDDCIEVHGMARAEARSKQGFEVDVIALKVLNAASNELPFHASSAIDEVGLDVILDHRPLGLRTERGEVIFKLQAEILNQFREILRKDRFTEILSSKIVASGTEGGTHLFEIKYFERAAYLAQSPQFFKEHGVAGFERVFETGHVYRAEPHATSRHLTEYYSLDLEMGFIESAEDIIDLEKMLLTEMFSALNTQFGAVLSKFGRTKPLPSLKNAPVWEFSECLSRLKEVYGRTDLVDDLDPEGERQICKIAESETCVPAVFVVGFPIAARPFYVHPRGNQGAAESFDLLFEGLEITTGGQRLHLRSDLERALIGKGMNPQDFEGHLKMFELGMPPHGGLAIGLERLTAQILKLPNVREATLYPRDRYRVTP